MYFYATIVKGINDGTESREVLKFTDDTQAKAKAMTSLGSALGDSNCIFGFVSVRSRSGVLYYEDGFEKEGVTD